MIRSYRSKAAEAIMEGRRPKGLGPDIIRSAKRRLIVLDSAESLDDLRGNPGNRLEALKGERKGQFSIRINDQYRICFRWHENGAEDVEIVDYH